METSNKYKQKQVEIAVAEFMENLKRRLNTNGVDSALWVRKERFPVGTSGVSSYVEQELYLTTMKYSKRRNRIFYFIFNEQVPFIARTKSMFGDIEKIYIGDENIISIAQKLMEEMRTDYPSLTTVQLLLDK